MSSDKKNNKPQDKPKIASYLDLLTISMRTQGLPDPIPTTESAIPTPNTRKEDLSKLSADAKGESEITVMPIPATVAPEMPTTPVAKSSEKKQSRRKAKLLITNRTQRGTAPSQAPKKLEQPNEVRIPAIKIEPAPVLEITSSTSDNPTVVPKPQQPVLPKDKAQLRLEREKKKKKDYSKRKKEENRKLKENRWGQYLSVPEASSPDKTKVTQPPEKKKNRLPELAVPEKKLPPTPNPVMNSFATTQTPTELASSSVPSVASETPEPVIKLNTAEKPPVDKKMELDPIFFSEMPNTIVKSCLNELKVYSDHPDSFVDITIGKAYQAIMNLAIERLDMHKHMVLTLNDPLSNKFAELDRVLQTLLAGIASERYVWCYINAYCKAAISLLLKGATVMPPATPEDPMEYLIKKIKSNTPDELVWLTGTVEEVEVFKACKDELYFNRNKAKDIFDKNILELQALWKNIQQSGQQDAKERFIKKSLVLDPHEHDFIRIKIDLEYKNFYERTESFKLEAARVDKNKQELALIAYELTIAVEELNKQHENLENSQKELRSHFLEPNPTHDSKARNLFYKCSEDVRRCEISCIEIFKKNQLRLNFRNLKLFGLEKLIAEIKPLLLLHEKQIPNSIEWLSQFVQNKTLRALQGSFSASSIPESKHKIAEQILELEKASKSMTSTVDAPIVQKIVRPYLEGLKILSDLYQLSENLKYSQKRIKSLQRPLQNSQVQLGALTEKNKAKLKQILQDLDSNTLAQLKKIDQYIYKLASSSQVTRPLRELQETITYFYARALTTSTDQNNEINALLQPTVNSSEAPPPLRRNDETPVVLELKYEEPKLTASSSRFLGKAPVAPTPIKENTQTETGTNTLSTSLT